MQASMILERAAGVLVPPMLVVAVYLLFAGHNAPGGGFVGGLVAGLGIALAAAAGGPEAVRGVTRVAPASLLGTGLVIAGLTGVGGWILGQGFLDGGAASIDIPLIGEIKFTSALLFDIGVFAVVAGMVGICMESLTRKGGPE